MDTSVKSHFLTVDGVNTHYLEAGSGAPVILLHGGEFGGCSEFSWEHNIASLARRFHVVAPDWLGFGLTAKLHDFENSEARRLQHMRRFLDIKGIKHAHFVGNSMGGSIICRAIARDPDIVPAKSLALISAGGFAPENEWRQALTSYDCSRAGMQKILAALFHDPKWTEDEKYLERRYQMSLIPGAWECAAASRFKNPLSTPRADFGRPDETPYDAIVIPVMIVAGARDKLRNPGYAVELANRIPTAEAHTIAEAGHCPQIERPDVVNPLLLDWLERQERLGQRA